MDIMDNKEQAYRENEMMAQAYENMKAKRGNIDTSAYNSITPGKSNEPMTKADIQYSIEHTEGSYNPSAGQYMSQQQGQWTYPSDISQSSTDELLFGDIGPSVSEFNGWKKEYTNLWYVDDFESVPIVYRSITRFEFKEISNIPDITALHREELIFDRCVLWPKFNWEQLSQLDAGVISTVSEQIMINSGFTQVSSHKL